VLLLAGCQQDSITDTETKKEMEAVVPPVNSIVIEISNDAMLGVTSYSKKKLVIDTEYYSKNKIKRGDIVYFSYPDKNINQYALQDKMQILRVVGLGEERISMKKGQIIINGKQLDAFYGHDISNNLRELKLKLKEPDLNNYEIENIKNAINFVENENMDELLIPKEMVFLIGDNRAQALDSSIIGPISKNNIIGKVIGELK